MSICVLVSFSNAMESGLGTDAYQAFVRTNPIRCATGD